MISVVIRMASAGDPPGCLRRLHRDDGVGSNRNTTVIRL